MNKLILISLFIVLFQGCSSKYKNIQDNDLKYSKHECIVNNKSAPKWICKDFDIPNKYICISKEEISRIGDEWSKKQSKLNAVKKLKVDMKNILDKNMLLYKYKDDIDNINKYKVSIIMSELINMYIDENHNQLKSWKGKYNYWSLIEIDKNKIDKYIKKEIEYNFNNLNPNFKENLNEQKY